MAEGNGITWGGMIKGAVKIASYVVVGLGIAALTSAGLEAAVDAEVLGISAEEGTVGHSLATAGAVIASSIAGVTQFLGDAITAPINFVSNVLGDSNQLAATSELDTLNTDRFEAVQANSAPEAGTPEAEALKDMKEALGNVLEGAMTPEEFGQLFDIENLTAADLPNNLQAQLTDLENKYTAWHELATEYAALDTITAEQAQELANAQNELTASFVELNNNEAAVQAQIEELRQDLHELPEGASETKISAIENKINALEDGLPDALSQASEKVVAAHENTANIVGADKLTQEEIGNIRDNWAIAGGAAAAGGLAYRAGKNKGARDVANKVAYGSHSQRVLEQQARAAAMQNQLG